MTIMTKMSIVSFVILMYKFCFQGNNVIPGLCLCTNKLNKLMVYRIRAIFSLQTIDLLIFMY